MAQKRKDWNGLISGFKASGLTDGSRAVSTKKEDPLLELALQEGVFFLVSQMTSSISTFTIYSLCHPPQKSSAVQKVYKRPLRRCAPALPEGEPLAGRVTFHWTPKARIWRKRAGLATEGSGFWTSAPCQATVSLDSGALPFPGHRALLVQTKADRHARGSPSGRAGGRKPA